MDIVGCHPAAFVTAEAGTAAELATSLGCEGMMIVDAAVEASY